VPVKIMQAKDIAEAVEIITLLAQVDGAPYWSDCPCVSCDCDCAQCKLTRRARTWLKEATK
jgi:hypothetical protein